MEPLLRKKKNTLLAHLSQYTQITTKKWLSAFGSLKKASQKSQNALREMGWIGKGQFPEQNSMFAAILQALRIYFLSPF